MVVALALSALAPAMANGHGNDNGRQGNNDCYVQTLNETYKNPGEMFRAIREATGENPVEWIEDRPADTVGNFIWRRCANTQ
jgi:hypothetical protein